MNFNYTTTTLFGEAPMNFFEELLKAANYKIIGGSEFLWKCFGPNAYVLDFNVDEDIQWGNGMSITFDNQNQTVYCVECFSETHAFRWVHSEYADAYFNEHTMNGADPKYAFDNTKWIDVTDATAILHIIKLIVAGEDCSIFVSDESDDPDIVKNEEDEIVTLNLEKDLIADLAIMAHNSNMTLNDFINEILRLEMIKNEIHASS